MGESALRSRAPRESSSGISADWADAAARLLGTCPDPDVRDELTALFDETAVVLEDQQGLDRPQAQQQAFGQLLFELVKRCVAVRSVPTDPAPGKGGGP